LADRRIPQHHRSRDTKPRLGQGLCSGRRRDHLYFSAWDGALSHHHALTRIGGWIVEPNSRAPGCPPVQLGALDTETAHGVTGVASLILLADICDQRLRALHFDFEGGDQCIFGVNDDVSRFALNFKADRKLHLCLPLSILKNIAQSSCEVEL
jgi:hypothetical protein